MKKFMKNLFVISSAILSIIGSYWMLLIVENLERFHMEDIYGRFYELYFAPFLGLLTYVLAWFVFANTNVFWKRAAEALLTAIVLSGFIHWSLIHFGIVGGNFGYRS